MAFPVTLVRAADFPFNVRGQAQANAQSKELLQAAFAASEAGNPARALDLLDQAARLRPDQPDALNLRGAILLRQGDFVRAEAAFARAAALDPDLWAARFNLAEVPFRHRDYARARTLFDRLAAQTDRYKATSQWELVQYKAVLCSLLLDDQPGAQRRLVKLTPTTATPSPVFLFAQAATAFARKDPAGANRFLATAQAAGKPGANLIYLRALESAGWPVAALLAPPLPGMPGGSGSIAGGNGPGRPSQPIIPNQPITEPELPGAAPSAAGGVGPSALTGRNGRAAGRPIAVSQPLTLPPLTIVADPGDHPTRETTPAPESTAVSPAPEASINPTGEGVPATPPPHAAPRRELDLGLLVRAAPPEPTKDKAHGSP